MLLAASMTNALGDIDSNVITPLPSYDSFLRASCFSLEKLASTGHSANSGYSAY